MNPSPTLCRYAAVTAMIVLALAGAYYVSSRPMDFRVYYYGARGVSDGTRPFYGPASGMGWPMHYRYPPLFLMMFSAVARLPLAWAAAIWLLLKCGVLAVLVPAMWRRFVPADSYSAWIVPLLLAGPYVLEDFRYGNAQFFVVALTAVAFLQVESRPKWAGAALGLAISTKVWPLFFVPYLLARRKSAAAVWSLIFTVVLTLLPGVFIGFRNNLGLLHEWIRQESSIQLGKNEIWFPSQSLRGVMMRYLTQIDYTRVPDPNYPPVNFADFSPHAVVAAWQVTAVIIYIVFLAFCRWRMGKDDWTYDALAFCLLPLLEPFTPKYALIVLLWPAIVLGGLTVSRRVRIWSYCPAVIILVQPLASGAAAQRLLQALGLDFVAT